MGDRRVCDSPPAISWQSYSSSALLETVQEITKVLQERVAATSDWEMRGLTSLGTFVEVRNLEQGAH